MWNQNPFIAEAGLMHVLSDDYAEVWVNGHQVDRDIFPHTDGYWNRKAKMCTVYFRQNRINITVSLVEENGLTILVTLAVIPSNGLKFRMVPRYKMPKQYQSDNNGHVFLRRNIKEH